MTNIHSTIVAGIFSDDISTHAQVVAWLKREVDDEEVSRFRNLRSLSASDWEKFNCSTGVFDDDDDDDDDDRGGRAKRKKKKRKVNARRSYHYKIGDLKTSTYYTKFLSDSIVRVPGGVSECTVRELSRNISRNPKSNFRSWFRMPLYKVEELASRIVTEKVITLSHHCRTEEQLKLKAELLVMGSLAILSGIYTSFRQIPTLTNIGATDHSKFFLKFVHFLWGIRDEYIFLPKDREHLGKVQLFDRSI